MAGGNSGLGVETARAMAHAGAKVILTSRKMDAGHKVADELQASGVKVSISLADLLAVHSTDPI